MPKKQINYNHSRGGLIKLIGALIILFTTFPYVQILPLETYTQPYALILSVLVLVLQPKIIASVYYADRIALLGLASVGICIFLLSSFPYTNGQEYKYLLNYISPIFITLASLKYLSRQYDNGKKILQISILIWLSVSVIQKFINHNFASALVGQWGEHSLDIIESGRGVLSLAPEPTHHAFHILILAACLIQLDLSRFSRVLVFLCILDAIFLAFSSSAVLALGLATLAMIIFYQLWLALGLGVCLAFTTFFDIQNINNLINMQGEGRLFMLINEVLAQPSLLLSIDYSLNVRLGGMLATFIASGENFLIPHGLEFASWEANREKLLHDLPWLMDLSTGGPPSGIGVLVFQIGVFALPFIWHVFKRILSIRVGPVERLVLLSIPFIFLGQYYISAPTFSLLYACAIYRLNNATPGGNFLN